MKRKRILTISALIALVLLVVPLYTIADMFIADIDNEEEYHTHGDDCYCPGGELICELPEEGHIHDETCFGL